MPDSIESMSDWMKSFWISTRFCAEPKRAEAPIAACIRPSIFSSASFAPSSVETSMPSRSARPPIAVPPVAEAKAVLIAAPEPLAIVSTASSPLPVTPTVTPVMPCSSADSAAATSAPLSPSRATYSTTVPSTVTR